MLTDPVTNEPIFGELGRVSPRYETPPGTPTGPPGTPPPPYTVNANFATVSIRVSYSSVKKEMIKVFQLRSRVKTVSLSLFTILSAISSWFFVCNIIK